MIKGEVFRQNRVGDLIGPRLARLNARYMSDNECEPEKVEFCAGVLYGPENCMGIGKAKFSSLPD